MNRIAETASWLVGSPLFALTLTVAAYWLADRLWVRAGRHALLTPLLTSSAAIGMLIVALGIDYEAYASGAAALTFLLGPATVALAVPLYREAARVGAAALMVVGAVLAGSVVSILAGYWAVVGLGGTPELAASMAPKSVTMPIAVALSVQVGGVAPLTVVFVIVAGMSGAVFGPRILDLVRVRDPRARGLAMGVASHGIGTARALQSGEVEGAFSGLGMGLAGLVVSLLVTWVVPG